MNTTHARAVPLPIDDVDQTVNPDKHPLVDMCLRKCLADDHQTAQMLHRVQSDMNELQRLANVGVVNSILENTPSSHFAVPAFDEVALRRLWAHFQSSLNWHGVVPSNGDLAPMLSRSQFVEICVRFFAADTSRDPFSNNRAVEVIDPHAHEKSLARASRATTLGQIYDQIDAMNGLQRLDVREVIVRMSTGVLSMSSAERLSFFWDVYRQPGKRPEKPVVDYVDIAQLLERGIFELRELSGRLIAWCDASADANGECSGEEMVKSAESNAAVAAALHHVLMC